MEIEFKYQVEKSVAEKLFEDEAVLELRTGSPQVKEMRAVYFDTVHQDMSKNKMAFRIRSENGINVATLKWSGGSIDGLHIREEANRALDGQKTAENPSIDIFADSPEIYEKLKKTVGGNSLVSIMETNFIRRYMMLDTGKSISEFSFDYGEIIAGDKKLPICEIEIEFVEGERDDFVKLSGGIAKRYGLTPSDASKFQRGMDLRCLL